jgi:uncharacterized protein (DUF1810 family)
MSLERFVDAQARVWPRPLEEIRAGRKDGHWTWFVFPQLRGLGRSPTAERYGLADLDEARAYLAHPVLGPRLTGMAQAMLQHEGIAPETILGGTDALKLRSCATLFRAAGGDAAFGRILDAFYHGAACPVTCDLIAGETANPADDPGQSE